MNYTIKNNIQIAVSSYKAQPMLEAFLSSFFFFFSIFIENVKNKIAPFQRTADDN